MIYNQLKWWKSVKTENKDPYTMCAKFNSSSVLYLSFHKLLNIKGNAVSIVFVKAQLRFTFDGRVPVILHRVVCPSRGIENVH